MGTLVGGEGWVRGDGAVHIGDTREGVHEDMKVMFKVKTTTTLNKKEFNDYLEKIKQWAAQFLGLAIPDPDQVDF
jgi:hypothetical protein